MLRAGDQDPARIERFALFTLDDRTERDDHCADIYHKSLLYLVSNAFEEKPRIPLIRDGVPIVGMDKFVRNDKELMELFGRPNAEWVRSPNAVPDGKEGASRLCTTEISTTTHQHCVRRSPASSSTRPIGRRSVPTLGLRGVDNSAAAGLSAETLHVDGAPFQGQLTTRRGRCPPPTAPRFS